MTFGHHGTLVPKLLIFDHFRGLSQSREKGPVGPNGLAREAILPFCHQVGYLAGGLVAHCLEALGAGGAEDEANSKSDDLADQNRSQLEDLLKSIDHAIKKRA